MSRSLKIYLFGFIVLIAVMVVIDRSREKPLVWSPTYSLDEKKPLDLYVLQREIDHLFRDSIIRYDKNPYEYFVHRDSSNNKKETYLFIGEYFNLDETVINKMLEAVRRGSTLFVVAEVFYSAIADSLQTNCEYAPYNNTTDFRDKFGEKYEMKLRFSNEAWQSETYSYSTVFGQYVFVSADTTFATALGYMAFADDEEYINFMEFKYGEGKIFLHNQPVAFSNYSLLSNEKQQEYAERTLRYLPDQKIVWFVDSNLGNKKKEKTELSVIFQYRSLRMAWLIFIYGLVLFVFFTAKRKQRTVPIIKPLRNTSVEFAQTIGNLYFQEGDHTDMAHKKIIYFMDRVRRSYHIDAQWDDDTLIRRLHLKSGKSKELITDIISLIRGINRYDRCGKEELIQLSTLMDRFWENVKEI